MSDMMTVTAGSVPKTARERGKIAPTKLAHVAVKTSRLKEMTDWYCTVLEAEIAFSNEDVAFLAYDDEHHRIAVVRMPDLAEHDSKRAGVEHFSFCYADLKELLETYERLKAKGIEPYWPIVHGPTTSLYFKDPDGNKVELQIDNFDTREELEAFFASGSYEENFMGIIFDPDEMLAKLRAGAPQKELTKRGKLPEGMTPWDMLRE